MESDETTCARIQFDEINKNTGRMTLGKDGAVDFRSRNANLLNRATIGLSTFCAANHPAESCGSNGLPLTPNSIQILGKFYTLSQLQHPNLCTYAEIFRIQHGNIS
jgi:hypothetical protein